MRQFHVLVTGGTIDKVYDPNTGLMIHQDSSIAALLKKGRCQIPYGISTLFLKDSTVITDDDRAAMRHTIESIVDDTIIVTHGTDTMIATATYLSHIHHKTIICVGAFVPSSLNNSDAEFNMGAAVAYTQVLPYGSYVAMNGLVHSHDHVEKDYVNQLFKFKE